MKRYLTIGVLLLAECISFLGTTLQAENVEHESVLYVNYGGM